MPKMAEQELKAAAPYVFDPLVAPKLKAGDPDSVRRFFDKYDEYTEAWTERQGEGTIEVERAPMSVLRCTDRKVRERIKVYELKKDRDHVLTNGELVEHLKAKFENVVREVSLQQVLGHIRIDRKQHDPVEKVGRMFQTVDSLLERHGILNRFEEKHVAKFILAAVEPKELKARLEYEVTTKEGKEKIKTLAGLYDMLIEKYRPASGQQVCRRRPAEEAVRRRERRRQVCRRRPAEEAVRRREQRRRNSRDQATWSLLGKRKFRSRCDDEWTARLQNWWPRPWSWCTQ